MGSDNPRPSPSRLIILGRWSVVAPLSVALGALFTFWHVPAAWILGAIIVSGACALITGQDLPLHRSVHVFGRGIIAMLAALPLISTPVVDLLRFLLPGVVTSALIVIFGIVGGLLLSRSNDKISPETGVLSMLAGGSSVMPLLARELGADFRYVTLSQYLRLLIVSVTLPLVAHYFMPSDARAQAPPSSLAHIFGLEEFTSISLWTLSIIFLVVIFGERLGKLLHLPSPAILGALTLTIILRLIVPGDISFEPPTVCKILAFLAIGWMCGGSLSTPALKLFAKQIPITLVFIFLLMGMSAGLGAGLAHWLGISFFDAYLATSPGAIETVLALSSEGDGGPAVVTIQVIRLLIILFIAGWLPKILRIILRKN